MKEETVRANIRWRPCAVCMGTRYYLIGVESGLSWWNCERCEGTIVFEKHRKRESENDRAY
jgi:hypothetical protein